MPLPHQVLLFAWEKHQSITDPLNKPRPDGKILISKQQLNTFTLISHAEDDAAVEMEHMLSNIRADREGRLDFEAFKNLNLKQKSLLRPLGALRKRLRAQFVGEGFWRRADRFRETLEAETLRCIVQ